MTKSIGHVHLCAREAILEPILIEERYDLFHGLEVLENVSQDCRIPARESFLAVFADNSVAAFQGIEIESQSGFIHSALHTAVRAILRVAVRKGIGPESAGRSFGIYIDVGCGAKGSVFVVAIPHFSIVSNAAEDRARRRAGECKQGNRQDNNRAKREARRQRAEFLGPVISGMQKGMWV